MTRTVDSVRVAVLTVSDAVSRGERADRSGDAIETWAEAGGYRVVERAVVPDDQARIAMQLREWSDGSVADLILTTGGTGMTARDLTPEATRSVLEREAPGLAEALRHHGARSTRFAWLSRGVAGIRGRTLLVNLPGSTAGVRDGLDVLGPLVDHAVQLVRGRDTHLHPDHG